MVLQEPAFQRLIFITMLAWENPCSKEADACGDAPQSAYFKVFLLDSLFYILLHIVSYLWLLKEKKKKRIVP